MNILGNLGGELVPCKSEQAYSPSLINTLSRRKVELEARLADVNAALDALNKNPEIQTVLELLAKAN